MLDVPDGGNAETPGSVHWFRRSDLVAAPMDAACALSVIIPARDERELIGGALRALSAQQDLAGRCLDPSRYEVIVLANNCADDTAAVVRAAQRRFPELRLHVAEVYLPVQYAHVGVARRTLMDEAARRFRKLARPGGVIASTDADTRVDPHWVVRTLAAVHAGADAVGGRIVVERGADAFEPWSRRYHLRDVGYRMLASELTARIAPEEWDPWPRHFQHFGPSLAVTTAAYERAGGLPPHHSLEDVALYRALRRIDARVRHEPAVCVETSARPSERTMFGFACQMRDWSRMGAAGLPHLVRSPGALEARAVAHRELRRLWRRVRRGEPLPHAELREVAAQLAVETVSLGLLVERSSTFGCLIERVEALQQAEGAWTIRWPDVDIREAIAGLRERLGVLRSAGASLEHIESEALVAAAD